MQDAAAARVAGLDGIHKAVQRGNVAAVRDYLIADIKCANVRGDYKYDWTPSTTFACIFVQCVSVILISCSIRCTPLHYAGIGGCIEVCKLLVSAKADVLARNQCDAHRLLCKFMMRYTTHHASPCRWEETPLDSAIYCSAPDVAAFLRSVGDFE